MVATVLTISITLLAGFGVFGYVNGQAGVTENQYGQAVGQTVQFLEERLVVTQFAFSTGTLTIYLYNNGRINLQVAQIDVYDSTKTVINVEYSASGATDLLNTACTAAASSVESPILGMGSGAFALSQGSVSSLKLTLPSCALPSNWSSGTAYYAEVTAQYGNQVVYYQVD